MVDAQFDVMPILKGIPLNAVELQQAIITQKPFKFVHLVGDLTEAKTKKYMSFIPHYLYYFNSPLDNRRVKERYTFGQKTNLFLVSIGAKEPKVFQRKNPIDYAIYTHKINDFYAKP